MCGKRLRASLLGLVLLFVLSFPCYSEKSYYITESQLQEMEQIQKDQQEQLNQQKEQLENQEKREENLMKLQENLKQEVEDLEKSYQTSERINKFLKIAVPVCSVICFGGGFYLGYRLSR